MQAPLAAKKRAVVLLSGGLDSAVTLAFAGSAGFECFALTVDYGQRNRQELSAAARLAFVLGAVAHKVVSAGLRDLGGSALTDDRIAVPKSVGQEMRDNEFQVLYVPARNLVFLSLATAWAEVVGATDIFIGLNASDQCTFPDCRGEFLAAFQELVNRYTAAGTRGASFCVQAPFITSTKANLISRGIELGVDYSLTFSCYDPAEHGKPCGICGACRSRRAGFREASCADPADYARLSAE